MRTLRADRTAQVALALVLVRASATPAVTASATAAAPSATAAGPKVIAKGQLQRVDDLHRGTGPVQLIDDGGKLFARFDNVAIQNGPDLQVYLARGMGGQYDGSRDLYLGKSIVVWCRAFAVLFTWADLSSG